MLPIRDHNPSGKFPFITYLIIALNSLIFLYMFLLPENLIENFVNSYALIPALVIAGQNLIGLFTSIFLHGSFGHILGNMLFLNIFGDNLEDRLGHLKYLIFYFVCGLGASLLQIITNPSSTTPNIGASGAIAGLLGGYLVLFPNHQIDVLFSFGWTFRETTVPASFMLFYWFLAQLVSGAGSLALPQTGGIAYFAHIGGFLTGYFLIKIFKRRKNHTPGKITHPV